MMAVVYEVCRLCFEENPQDTSLVYETRKCKRERLHKQSWDNVRVIVRSDKLEKIRPLPQVNLRGRRFVLCHGGSRCRGDDCSFAHSPEERDIWNEELRQNHPSTSHGWLPPSGGLHKQSNWTFQPPSLSRSDWPDLPGSNEPLASPVTWQQPLEHAGPYNSAWQWQHSTSMKNPPTSVVLDSAKKQFPLLAIKKTNEKGTEEKSRVPQFDKISHGVTSSVQSQKPIGAIPVAEIESREFDSGLLLESDSNQQEDTSRLSDLRKSKTRSSSQRNVIEDPLYSQLTVNNYKKKFNRLIKAERESHEGILRERCNGLYHLTFAGSTCPKYVVLKKKEYKFFVFIDGLSSDNLSYINQASDSAMIRSHSAGEFSADIYRQRHTKRLVAAFTNDCHNHFNNNCQVPVRFNLKESYFKDLEDSVEALKPNIISRIMPTSESFDILPVGLPDDVKEIEHYCSAEQSKALQMIVTSPSTGPPFLLAGAFGTGKSRLLALSVRYFQKRGNHKNPVRVLVCTQQRVSADKFLEYYIETWVEAKCGEVYVIRDYGYKQIDSKYEHFYISSRDFQRDYKKFSNILIITTCLTAPHLWFIKPGYFTHIFIDEGSQMREPEAIAPLYLAHENTKIIIAGDQNQVGPALLVLGDIPQKNGLGISLLERLQTCYQALGNVASNSIGRLSANYRCHSDIVDLVGKLFYDSQLLWAEGESPPITHRCYDYPLAFICSDCDRSGTFFEDYSQHEADIIVEKTLEIVRSSPPGWGKPNEVIQQLFLVSPCEEQVFVIKEKFKNMEGVPDIKSTINIQGREFQAVLLSTTEPTHTDGSTRNLTRSLCDPYVFNTAMTRAKSLVVAVGNPFLLLSMEKHMIKRYGKRGNCWSSFLKKCIEKNTLELPHVVSDEERRGYVDHLCQLIQEVNPDQQVSKEELALKEKVATLQALLQSVLNPPVVPPQPSYSIEASPIHVSQVQQKGPVSLSQSQNLLAGHNLLFQSSLSGQDSTNSDVQRQTPTQELSMQDSASLHQESSAVAKSRLVEFNRENVLGHGGFGVVHHVTSKSDNTEFALKIIRLDDRSGRQEKKWREVDALKDLKDDRIVQYINSWVEMVSEEWWSCEVKRGIQQQNCLCILMELCEKDTLKHWLLKNRGENSRNRKAMIVFFEQVLDALCFIHEKNYIHRDLKPSNIFFSRHDEDKLKVGDFGLVTYDQPPKVTVDASGNAERPSGSSFCGAGTFPYISPEQQNPNRRKKLDAKTDIYSLGIILFELHHPRVVDEDEKNKVFVGVRGQRFPPKFKDMLTKVHDLVRLMTSIKPQHRPSASIIKNNQLADLKRLNRKARKASVPVL